MSYPVELTRRYATMVTDMTQAWSFVMEHLDNVGNAPSIDIHPVWVYEEDDSGVRGFEVSVMGMVEE